MNLLLITPEEALRQLPVLTKYFNKAIAHGQGESTLTDYMRKILNKQAQCWLAIDGAHIVGVGLTEILEYAQHKTVHIIVFSCDDFEKCYSLFPIVEEFAKQQGCTAVEQWGRKGWAKALPKYVPGFEEAYVVMRKPIDNLNKGELL